MANVKKGNLIPVRGMTSWWRHMKLGKKHFWRAHRKAERAFSRAQAQENVQ